MRCTYVDTIFKNSEDGYCIMVFKTQENIPISAAKQIGKQSRFIAKGYQLPATDAFELDLQGQWVNDKKHGLQFDVASFKELLPPSKEGIIGYLSSGLISGVGSKTAKTIVDKFGLNTLNVLDEDPEKLLTVKGISKNRLAQIKESYTQNRQIRDIVTFLLPFGITVNKAAKIYKEFGGRSMEVLKKTPFELCNLSGFAFRTADAISRKTACQPNDPMRIQGALFYLLDDCKSSGHLFLDKNDLRNKAYHLLNERFPNEVVSATAINNELYQMVVSKALLADAGNIYKPQSILVENSAAKRVAELLLQTPQKLDISTELEDVQKTLNIVLADKQMEAVRNCFANMFSIVTGGPGTGKTTILKVILNVFRKLGNGKVMLMAPTGRAARRMAETTGFMEAATIHNSIGLITDGEEVFGVEFVEIDADLLIVDETSMVDMFLFRELIRRIPLGCRVLLVGDADQLPSVGPGNVFKELLQCEKIPVTTLNVVYRQEGTSSIVINSTAIRQGETLLRYDNNFQFINCSESSEAARFVQQYYAKEVKEKGVENVQILSAFRSRGDCSVKSLNEAIQNQINPAGPPELKTGSRIFRLGDRVIQLKNLNEISNGDVGFITSIAGDSKIVTVTFSENRVIEYEQEDLSNLELAYAMTIHKSQGGEYETVIIPLVKEFSFMMRRNLIYTSITRASQRVVLVGEKMILNKAIHRNDSMKRNTMLEIRIRRWMDKLTEASGTKVPEQMRLKNK